MEKGEVIAWVVEDKNTLIIKRTRRVAEASPPRERANAVASENNLLLPYCPADAPEPDESPSPAAALPPSPG